ncbi:Outer membrane protein (OmpH-like) [Ekhidna lutea]|uniref:Outer membrane protein (OmpH-like) n=1 Tax=Ekhidna lutea TaxID=447679 RepID=A0A239KBA2_EKHLU|nr:OmpH family outer membrane protein [Ekhidna lutea]SNT14394.1 Outer membrane protein (OmpH-like) [Ekhidna lutea]
MRNNVLIENYKGIEEIREYHFQQLQAQNQKLDSLTNLYAKAKESNSKELKVLESELISTQVWINNNRNLLENPLFQGALEQINSYIAEYSERNNLDLVLGSNLEGNIMYGRKELDITEEILEGLNKAYDN